METMISIEDLMVLRASSRRILDVCDSRFNKRDIIAEASAILKLANGAIERAVGKQKCPTDAHYCYLRDGDRNCIITIHDVDCCTGCRNSIAFIGHTQGKR